MLGATSMIYGGLQKQPSFKVSLPQGYEPLNSGKPISYRYAALKPSPHGISSINQLQPLPSFGIGVPSVDSLIPPASIIAAVAVLTIARGKGRVGRRSPSPVGSCDSGSCQ